MMSNSQLLALCALGQESVEKEEEGLSFGVEDLFVSFRTAQPRSACIVDYCVPSAAQVQDELTFFFAGSVTPWTILLSSFRMVLAATPVVAERKSCCAEVTSRENEFA